jgi:hypothetical protein
MAVAKAVSETSAEQVDVACIANMNAALQLLARVTVSQQRIRG